MKKNLTKRPRKPKSAPMLLQEPNQRQAAPFILSGHFRTQIEDIRAKYGSLSGYFQQTKPIEEKPQPNLLAARLTGRFKK